MKITVFETADKTLTGIADHFVEKAKEAIALRGKFSVALSGGSSPKRLYEMLASPAYKNQIVWEKVYFFFGDERYVPQTDPDSNYRMAQQALFDPLNIQASHIFAVNTALSPKDAANDYANDIGRYFDHYAWNFDLVLLGLGNDSHTASLFPYTAVLYDQKPAVKEVFLEDKQVFRITLNAPLINQAHQITFLVYGKEKAAAVKQVIEAGRDLEKFPAQLINPVNGEAQWFLDNEAASELT